MKRLAIVAALLAIGVAVPLSLGSSHREAPLSSIDPTGDDTDVYAFTAPDAQHSLTVVANWVPFEDPAGGPNFYKFDPKARYYINIDNTGDGRPDVRYRFRFKDHLRNPESFLYAAPPVDSINSANLNVYQTYEVDRLVYGKGGRWYAKEAKKGHKNRKAKHHRKGRHRKGHARRYKLRHSRTVLRDAFVAPNYVGPKTFPNYDAVANQAIADLPSGGKVFAGPREDPFFVDLGATFDALNLRRDAGAEGGGKDDLAGYGVHSIVLQVPEEHVTRSGEQVDAADDKDAVVGVWASTERKRVQVYGSDDNRGDDYVQVSRLGNPLVNEVVIPLGLKDKFNSTEPADDAQYAKYVVNPELAKLMNALFGLPAAGAGVPETGRADIVLALLQGIPGLNQQTGKPVDTLKLNLGTAPNDVAFPNGRRLTDDVVDTELRVVAGALADPAKFPSLAEACSVPGTKCPNDLKVGDGVDANDKAFSGQFPYVVRTESGFDSQIPKPITPVHPAQ